MIYSLISMFRAYSVFSISALWVALLLGCSAQQPVAISHTEPPEVMGPPIPEHQVESNDVPPTEIYGPEVPPAATGVDGPTSTATATAVPMFTATGTSISTNTSTSTASSEPARLCVVLGPGMAKAMAEAAVLDALRKARIPVHCVVGTEMGAVVGALFAHSNGNTNSLQWQLFKLNKDNYFNFPMLSLREPKSSGRRLHEFFVDVFRDSQIESLPIRFATTAVDEEGDGASEFDRGSLAHALSASVALSGIFEPWRVGEKRFHSSASVEPAPIELARRLGGNFIVLVDVLLEGTSPSKGRYYRSFSSARSVLRLQRKEVRFVIQVNTSSIDFDDFGRRADLVAAGNNAAEKAMPDLKAAWEKWFAVQR